jgi:hypothetical protein
MVILRVGVEHALDVAIERPQHTDARVQQWAAVWRPNLSRSERERDAELVRRAALISWKDARSLATLY